MAQTILSVPDISCEHCERTITEALSPIDGVTSVKVDIPARAVTVDYDDATVGVERFKEVLKDEDYPVAEVSR